MRPKLIDILDKTLSHYGICWGQWELIKNTRNKQSVLVKQSVCLVGFLCGYRHSEIAKFLSLGRSNVIHHISVLGEYYELYEDCKNDIDSIMNSLESQNTFICRGWLARSHTGLLTISPEVPEKCCGYWLCSGSKALPNPEAFPKITYETGPKKVRITITLEQ